MVREAEGIPSQQNIQKKLIEMETLRQRMQQLDQQLVALETRRIQMEEVLRGVSEIKGGEESLIPIGPGFFVKGRLEKEDKVVVAVGANMAMEKSIEDAKRDISDNMKEINKISEDLKSELLRISEEMDKYQDELIKYYGG